jgi:Acyl-CoA reductase (LuxC)
VVEARARRARVERLVNAARTLSDAQNPEGVALRLRLRETTGLSSANIESGLRRCLESAPQRDELEALLASTPVATVAHVLLSANVFVAAHRALAIAIASAERVQARPSRRDPALTEALHRLVPDLFDVVPRLVPEPGERLWAYGSDQTLSSVRAELPRGVYFHPHGSGFGAVIVDATTFDAAAARGVAWDAVLFDQRGCLSPRVVCVLGSNTQGRDVARLLAEQLKQLSDEVPPGDSSPEERAEARQHRDAAAYAFELFEAGEGWVTAGERFVLPPATRNLHVVACAEPTSLLEPWSPHLTNVATDVASLRPRLRAAFPGARVVAVGEMQTPPLDGPVDLRHGTTGELT